MRVIASLGRVDEAKQHIAALLKMYPTMTIREADAFYKLVCFDSAFREKMVGAGVTGLGLALAKRI